MSDQSIAIIGMAGRFPGAPSVAELWRQVSRGESGITHFRDEELAAAGIPDHVRRNRRYVKAGAILGRVAEFDAEFFRMPPAEAEVTDPQQRILLECAVEAFEEGGYDPASVRGQVGVFCGASMSTYLLYNLLPTRGFSASQSLPVALGNDKDYVSTLVSYKLGLKGPSVGVQTACSSSLVAVHLAVQSLLNGECDLALAGGVTVRVPETQGYYHDEGGITSPDGRTRPFDADAQGTVFGNGCALVLLKRLEEAIDAGDPIDGVILGSAINNDGSEKVAFTAPSVGRQAAVIAEAREVAGIDADTIGLIEAHGTATPIGDPIELTALTQAFRDVTDRTGFCCIGSVKANVGHLETAAGVAGLIKAVMAVKSGILPPAPGFERPNPVFDLAGSPFTISSEARDWTATDSPRRAGVSSFGIGGTNAHVILEEPPPRPSDGSDASSPPWLLPISAKTGKALRELAGVWAAFLRGSEEAVVGICTSAAKRRPHYQHRLAIVGSDRESLAERAEGFAAGEVCEGVTSGVRDPRHHPRVAFAFSGQGAQWLGMGLELAHTLPAFRDQLEACHEAFRSFTDWSLWDELGAEPDASQLHRVDVIQPCVFAMQVSLAAAWKAHGVVPEAVVGHSMGEVAAAYVADVLSLRDAARVICLRSEIVRQTSGSGAMAVVELSESELREKLDGYDADAVVAAVNGPTSCVVSARPKAMDDLLEKLEREGVFCRRVRVDYASHCPQMEPLLPELRRALAPIEPRRATLDVISSVSGDRVDGVAMGADYWCSNLRRCVAFRSCIERLLAEGVDTFIEVSPHPLLVPAIRDSIRFSKRRARVLATLRRDAGERQAFLENLAELHVAGVSLEWDRVYPRDVPFVRLPTYPWQRTEHWVGGQGTGYDLNIDRTGVPLAAQDCLGISLSSSVGSDTRYWQTPVSPGRSPFARGPVVELGQMISPAMLTAMAIAAAHRRSNGKAVSITEVDFPEPLFQSASGPVVQIAVAGKDDGAGSLTLSAANDPGACPVWARHLQGRVGRGPSQGCPRLEPKEVSPTESAEVLYEELAAAGMRYGPDDRVLESFRVVDECAAATVRADLIRDDDQARAVLLEAGLQLSYGIVLRGSNPPRRPFGVAEVKSVSSWPLTGRTWRVEACCSPTTSLETEIRVANERGEVVLEVDGVRLAPLSRRSQLSQADLAGSFYELTWQPCRLEEKRTVPSMPGSWLLLERDGAIGDRLASLLRGRGHECVRTRAGSGFRTLDDGRIEFDPQRRDHVEQLLRSSQESGPIAGVVHLLGAGVCAGDSAADALEVATQTLEPALYVVQTLLEREGAVDPRLVLVTRGAHSVVAGDEVKRPANAALWGMWMNLVQETREWRPIAIDLDVHGGAEAEEAEHVLGELLSDAWTNEVAVREATRYHSRLEALSTDLRVGNPAPLCQAERSYLITGGLGALGLATAGWLASEGARHLALMGRSSPSASSKVAVEALRDLGVDVLVLQGDVAELADATSAFASIDARMPPLAGVFHLAAVMDDAAARSLDWDRFASVLRPKIGGAWNLDRLTRDRDLDLFVLFSSVVSLVGSHGQSSYTAANRFLDALAYHRRARGLPALSVNWGAWQEAGKEGGESMLERRLLGVDRFALDVGFEALRRALRQPRPHIGFVPGLELSDWFRHSPHALALPVFAGLVSGETSVKDRSGQSARSELESVPDPDARRRRLAKLLRRVIAEVLKISPAEIGTDVELRSLGMNSLLALELRRRLEDGLEIELRATVVYNYPTHSRLCDYLEGLMGLGSGAQQREPTVPASPVSSAWLDGPAIAALSEEDAEELLRKQLAAIDVAD